MHSLRFFLFVCLFFRKHSLKVWRRTRQPTPVLLPGKSHGRRSLVGYSPWGREESDTTERLHFHFSLSCIGAGNGNPLQYSFLENPRDWGACWAAVYGVTQSRTRLKRLSSSSSLKVRSSQTLRHVYGCVRIFVSFLVEQTCIINGINIEDMGRKVNSDQWFLRTEWVLFSRSLLSLCLIKYCL